MNVEELFSITMVNLVVIWVAVWMLYREIRAHLRFQNASAMFFWLLHVAVFWTFVAFYRVLLGYEGPSRLITLWSSVVYLQAGLSIIGVIIIGHRRKSEDD